MYIMDDFSVTGFNVWAAVLSVGCVCIFYTSLVSKIPDTAPILTHLTYNLV